MAFFINLNIDMDADVVFLLLKLLATLAFNMSLMYSVSHVGFFY